MTIPANDADDEFDDGFDSTVCDLTHTERAELVYCFDKNNKSLEQQFTDLLCSSDIVSVEYFKILHDVYDMDGEAMAFCPREFVAGRAVAEPWLELVEKYSATQG
jgi:hypothetical protein